jgi:hypothetical protein
LFKLRDVFLLSLPRVLAYFQAAVENLTSNLKICGEVVPIVRRNNGITRKSLMAVQSTEKLSSMVTPTGRLVDFRQPDPATISLEDISFLLSRVPRFGGATSVPFSVAEHTIHCDDILLVVLDRSEMWCGCPIVWGDYDVFDHLRQCLLLHDAHEAFTGDIITGLKNIVPGIREVQARLDVVIRAATGVGSPSADLQRSIDLIDREAMMSEALGLVNYDNTKEYFLPLDAVPRSSVWYDVFHTPPQLYTADAARMELRRRFHEVLGQ